MKLLGGLLIIVSAVLTPQVGANAQPAAAVVQDILSVPDDQLEYARAKLTFDRIVDPSINVEAILAEIDRLARAADALAGPGASSARKLAALRTVIYRNGAWNGGRPFAYDHADPLGQNVRNKLISTYLRTRRGNCVSMPILALLVGERMGVNLALSTAPLHVFLRYTDESGREVNLEATSDLVPTRTEWIRRQAPMSDRAIASGLYLRTLSRREGVALMASTVVDFLIGEGRFREAVEVAEIVLRNYPRDGHTMLKLGSAYAALMRIEFVERFATPAAIPSDLRQRYLTLAQRNQTLFAAAEALGWEAAR